MEAPRIRIAGVAFFGVDDTLAALAFEFFDLFFGLCKRMLPGAERRVSRAELFIIYYTE